MTKEIKIREIFENHYKKFWEENSVKFPEEEREIYTGMLCEDTVNFSTVVIKEIEGRFFAVTNGFKPEPLEEISEGLRIIK
jgi:hypothetical protein